MLWYIGLKHNFEAGAAPTVDDDELAGYSYGSLWYHDGQTYVCERSRRGDALWSPTSNMGTSSINGLDAALASKGDAGSIGYVAAPAGDADAAAVRASLIALIEEIQASGLMEPEPGP